MRREGGGSASTKRARSLEVSQSSVPAATVAPPAAGGGAADDDNDAMLLLLGAMSPSPIKKVSEIDAPHRRGVRRSMCSLFLKHDIANLISTRVTSISVRYDMM